MYQTVRNQRCEYLTEGCLDGTFAYAIT